MSGKAVRILDVIPRWIGGGPERSILALTERAAAVGRGHQRTVLVADPPATPAMFLQARRLGVSLELGPEPDRIVELVAAADLVVVHWWNHPTLTTLLRTVELPPTRILFWSRVLGQAVPHVLNADLARYADRLAITSELSRDTEGCRTARQEGTPVDLLVPIGDRGRLDGFTPKAHDGVRVGYIGMVSPTKMHPRFAQLCRAIDDPDVSFVVCGGGDEDRLREQVAELGIADRVDIRGPVEDIRSVLEELDVFGYPLAPDTYATSENALQEAMWVGVPPVVFPHGGVRALVEHEETGLVAHTDEQYTDCVLRLAADPALRSRLGAAARVHARSAFDPVRGEREFAAVVDALLAQPRRARRPLAGGELPAAEGFSRSLGEAAGPFAVSLRGSEVERGELDRADASIAAASEVVARGEGGVIHHRNAHPDDAHLRLWSGLVADGAGDHALARYEYEAAAALRLPDDRAVRYQAVGGRRDRSTSDD